VISSTISLTISNLAGRMWYYVMFVKQTKEC
jgi:hypothetical protein